MTEIEKTEGEIKVLQAKLELLKEMENHKSPVEEAYKKTFGIYPKTWPDASASDIQFWNIFQYGYKYGSGELHEEESSDCSDEVEYEIKEGTPPQESPPSEFRQKLFDGIKSVFYDPEYERTHWSVKVNMAVDEVLTHFQDVIPASQDPIYDDIDKGWNCCLARIKTCMEKLR